ncbi:hypothetical protein FQR65_LT12490 [Abscondita terminalis]|nr:hypothetical protein FQR65_LT12490 [Abscondita terminalis]
MNDFLSFWQKFKHKSFDETSSITTFQLNEFGSEINRAREDKALTDYEECLSNMRSKHKTEKLAKNLKRKSSAEKGTFDDKCLGNLITTIEELKHRVHYFENYFTYEIDRQKNEKRHLKQFVDFKHFPNNLKNSKLSSYTKKEDSKYSVNPVVLQDISYEQKNVGSDTSLIKSSLSLTKNTYINISPTLDSKHFKVAAHDFIKQAEELKNNITFILDNENCDDITVNDFENRGTDNVAVQNEDCESGLEQHLEYLISSVCSQYGEILKSLGNIEEQLKNSTTAKPKNPKLSLTSTKVSTYVPNSMYKVETFKNGTINTYCDVNLQNYKSHKSKKKKNLKKLDPVVLVYEPIKPLEFPQDIYNYCGHGSNSCVFGSCKNHLVKPIRYESKQDVCCGFMVSYTPNFNCSDRIDISSTKTENSLKKDDKKTKKRKKSCLWF